MLRVRCVFKLVNISLHALWTLSLFDHTHIFFLLVLFDCVGDTFLMNMMFARVTEGFFMYGYLAMTFTADSLCSVFLNDRQDFWSSKLVLNKIMSFRKGFLGLNLSFGLSIDHVHVFVIC